MNRTVAAARRSYTLVRTNPCCSRFLSTSKADFGFKDVDAAEKERMVKDVFSKVADKYDVMNDVMSFGTHRLWKDDLISMMGIPAAAKANPNYVPRHLDVAGGTGDIAFRSLNQMLSSYSGSTASSSAATEVPMGDRQIVVCDINPDMLRVGRQRAEKLYRRNGLDMVSECGLVSSWSVLLT
jgi:2-methoxy-6-polyprenyl-1,4-benzoquinol methylase